MDSTKPLGALGIQRSQWDITWGIINLIRIVNNARINRWPNMIRRERAMTGSNRSITLIKSIHSSPSPSNSNYCVTSSELPKGRKQVEPEYITSVSPSHLQ